MIINSFLKLEFSWEGFAKIGIYFALSLAELHECQQDFADNVVLLTTILCVLTIPLMSMLLIRKI